MNVVRTIISRADAITTDEDFEGLKQLFDQRLTERWIWVVDMKPQYYNYTEKRLATSDSGSLGQLAVSLVHSTTLSG